MPCNDAVGANALSSGSTFDDVARFQVQETQQGLAPKPTQVLVDAKLEQ
jgi:hypothetical protein